MSNIISKKISKFLLQLMIFIIGPFQKELSLDENILWLPGPHQKKMFKRDLHLTIQPLKKIKEDQDQEKENPKKKHQTLNNRFKEVEFRQEGKR